MPNRLRSLLRAYPRQFLVLLGGMLISKIGMSMIWPFLTIYLRQKLSLPLSTITGLLTIDTIMSILFSFIAGSVADRFGRKWVMVISMTSMGAIYLVMSRASSLPIFALLMALRGMVIPLYRVGADAMVVDLIPASKRPDAYALLRMLENLGVAIGPAIGGFLAAASYTIAFLGASVSLFFYGLLLTMATRETLPSTNVHLAEGSLGYGQVFRDRFFLSFVGAFTMIGMASSLVFALISVYVKENFGIPESQAGFLITINAAMVVFFQVMVTRFTRRRAPLSMMALGAFLYTLGVGGMAFGQSLFHFAVCMVIMTLGELVVAPTANNITASLAPQDMRGRYMSIYGLSWGVSHGLGPVVGGLFNDHVGPSAIWLNGMTWGALSTLVFLVLFSRRRQEQTPADLATR